MLLTGSGSLDNGFKKECENKWHERNKTLPFLRVDYLQSLLLRNFKLRWCLVNFKEGSWYPGGMRNLKFGNQQCLNSETNLELLFEDEELFGSPCVHIKSFDDSREQEREGLQGSDQNKHRKGQDPD